MCNSFQLVLTHWDDGTVMLMLVLNLASSRNDVQPCVCPRHPGAKAVLLLHQATPAYVLGPPLEHHAVCQVLRITHTASSKYSVPQHVLLHKNAAGSLQLPTAAANTAKTTTSARRM